jgi:hypothetical protein
MPWNVGNLSSINYFGLFKMVDVQAKNLHFSPDSSGNFTVYNVPSGKKVLLLGVNVGNTTSSAIGFVPCLEVSGVYYRLLAELSATANGVTFTNNTAYLYCSGDGVGIYTVGSGLNLYARALEFNQSSNIKKIDKIDNWSSGNHLIYTAGNNGTMLLDTTGNINTNSIQTLRYFNQSGSARNVKVYIVPNGQSVANHNALYPGTATISNNGLAAISCGNMSSGDSLYFYTDGGGQQLLFGAGIEL